MNGPTLKTSLSVGLLTLLAPAVALAYYGYPPVNLQQRNSDGTALCTGCTTTQGAEVQLTADSIATTCANIDYYLDFEVQPVGTPFTGVPTHTSPSMMKPSCIQQTYPWTSITGLVEGQSYHWQVRERTAYGTAAWVLFNGGVAAFTTGAAPAYHLAFTTAPQTVGQGDCSAVATVQRQDASNAPAPVATATTVTLADSLSYTTFYSDPTCTTAVTQVTIPASGSTASFYWKITKLLSHTVLADVAGAQWAEQLSTTVPGSPARLSFYITTSSVDVHACSAARQLRLYDAYNNLATVSSSLVASLTSNNSTTFYTDAACTTQVTSLTFPPGTNTLSFYAKENQVGQSMLTASSGSLTEATGYEYGYGVIAITSTAQTLTAGQCSPLPFTFQTRDGLGAAYPVASRTSFNLYGSGVTFHSGSNCNGNGSTSINLSTGSSTGAMYWKGTRSGTISLQVSASYYRYATQSQTVNPITPPIKLGFTSYAQTLIVGNCSTANKVVTQDTYANISPVSAAKAVTLSASLTGTGFYSDSTCTTALSGNQVTIPADSGTAPFFYWKATNPGSLVVTASATGLTSATLTHTVEPRFVFTSAPQTLVAGDCSALMTVQTQNASGAAAPVSSPTTISLYSYSYGTFYSDSACSTAITQTTIPNGGSTASFYYRDTKAGSANLYIYGSYIPAATQVQTIVAGPSAQLKFTTAAQVVGKTLCSGVTTVAQKDQYANNSTDAADRTVALTTSSGTMTFYSENTCTTPLAGDSLTIPAGSSTASFWFSDTTVGTPTITATSSPLATAQQQETISLGAATRLAFSANGVQTLSAGACSAQVTLQSRNASNNPENVIDDTVVDLTTTSAQGGFYSDAACAASISSVTLLAGTNSQPFFWKDTLAGAPTLTASTFGMQSASAAQTVNPGAAARLSFATAAQSLAAGACSQITTIQTTDDYDNASDVGGATTALLTSSSPAASFFSDASCTTEVWSVVIPAGSHTASFYWRDFSRGAPTLTASDEASVLSPGTQVQAVGGREQIAFRWYSSAGAALAAENAAAEISPGASVHLRIGVRVDAFTWHLSPGDVTVTGETPANVETVTGSYTATWADDTTYETLTEAKVGNGGNAYRTLGDPATAGSTSHVYSFGTGVPTGRPSYVLCLVAMTTGETLNVGWSATSTPGTPAFPGWQITTTGSPAETCFDLEGQGYAGGPLSIYLQDAIRGAGSDNFADTFTIDRVYIRGYTPTYLSLERAELSDFSDAVQIAAGELWNDAANTNGGLLASRLADTTVNEVFVETLPSVPGAQQDIGAGVQGEWDFAVVFPSTSGTYYYRMIVTDAAGNKTADFEALTAPAVAHPPATQLAFTTTAQAVTAGVCSGAATVERRDAAGNPQATPADVTIDLTSAPVGATFYSDPTCLTPLAGGALPLLAGESAASFYWKDTLAGSPVLTAAATGLTSAVQAQTVLPDAPAALAYLTAPQSLGPSVCSAAVTVQSRDQYGNPSPVGTSTAVALASSPAVGLSLYDAAGCGGAVASSVTMSGATSTATFWFRGTVGGSYDVTATAPFGSAVQTETITASPPTALAFTTSAQSRTAGVCSGPVTVETRDSLGNPSAVSSPLLVDLAAAPAAGFTFYGAAGCAGAVTSVTVPAAGTTATFYFQGTASGSVVVTASATSFTSTNQTEVITAGPPAMLAFTTAPQTLSAGSCSAAASLQATDNYGNPSPVAAATTIGLGVSPTTGFSFYAAAGCGGGAVSSVTLSGGASTVSFFFGGTAAGSFSVTATAPFGPATQTETINPGAPVELLVSGVSSPIVVGAAASATVVVRDASANVVEGYTGTVHFTSSDPSATLPADYTFTAGDLGTHTFNGISFATPGTQDLRATDTGPAAVTGVQTGIDVRQIQGGACATSGICATGFCADSVCCDSDCASTCSACNLAGSVGTCVPEPDGTTCPNATYCDGMEVCQAGACVAGPPVSCVDPLGDLPMQCDEGQQACVEIGGVAPAIARDATLTATVGLPYRYNAEARIRAVGTRPVTFGSCSGPPELHVDAKTGDVAWIPAAAGDVPLCLNVSSAFGSDSYSFTVTVAASAAGTAPVADLSATPLEGVAPLDVAYDGSASTVDPATTLVGELWELGDGSPWLTGATASNRFFLPGGVYSTLTVFDGVGRQGTARVGIRARDTAGRLPPLARITASAVRGTDSLDVDFACDCQPGDAAISSYQWDFGDGTATGATAAHTFAPGRYHVRLTAVDQSGLTASDVIEVAVARGTQEPPRCRAFALPPAGVAPLGVRHRLVYGDDDGAVISAVLTFSDGTSTTEVDSPRAYVTAGAFPARLLVTDDGDLTCVDQVQVVAVAATTGPPPPRFLSSGSRAAACGEEWRYSENGPQVSGDGPYEWSLLPVDGALPEGMTLEASTGQVFWLPSSAQAGEHRAILRVQGPGGTSDQLLDVVVMCGAPLSYTAGCCSSSGPGVAWLPIGFFVLLWLHRAGRRRRA